MTLNEKSKGQGHRERSQLRRYHQCLFPCKVLSLYWIMWQRTNLNAEVNQMLTDGRTDGRTDGHHQSISRNCFAIRPKTIWPSVQKAFKILPAFCFKNFYSDLLSKSFQTFSSDSLSKIFQRFAFKNFQAICFQNFVCKLFSFIKAFKIFQWFAFKMLSIFSSDKLLKFFQRFAFKILNAPRWRKFWS